MINDELDQTISMWRHADEVVLLLEKMSNKHADDMSMSVREKFENLAADAMALRKELLIKMSESLNV
jgi:hypothetical protein